MTKIDKKISKSEFEIMHFMSEFVLFIMVCMLMLLLFWL